VFFLRFAVWCRREAVGGREREILTGGRDCCEIVVDWAARKFIVGARGVSSDQVNAPFATSYERKHPMAEPKIADLQKLIASMESRLKSAEGKISGLESRVKDTEGFEARIKTLDGRVTDAWSNINELAKKVK
jgi:hypothetical protein